MQLLDRERENEDGVWGFLPARLGKEPHHSVHVFPHREAGSPAESEVCSGDHKAAHERTGVQVTVGGSTAAEAPVVCWRRGGRSAGSIGGAQSCGLVGHATRFNLYFVGNGEPWEDLGETGEREG